MKKFRSSKISRLTDMGKALTKAGSELLIEKFEKNTSYENIRKINAAREIIKSMGELKGAVMKLGQMLSVTEDLALPPEIVELFKKLQKDAPTVPYFQMKEVIKNELGDYPENLFKEFNPEPIASASIGQVYRGRTKDNIDFVLKVQYPDIDKAIESDLKNLDNLIKLFKIVFPQIPNIKPLIEELSESIINECNYNYELENILTFKKLFSSHKNIHFQEPLKEFSSQKVIATKFIEGDHFDQTKYYSQEVKNQLGESLYFLHLDQLFSKNIMHTDPQNGNYLFKQNKIYILDCGSIKNFDEAFINAYALLTYSIREENLDLFKRSLFELNIIREEDSPELISQFYYTAQKIYLPYTKEGIYAPDKINPVNFVSDLFQQVKTLKNRPTPHQDFVLLDRANLGIFTKLRSWESAINWQNGIKLYQTEAEQKAINYFSSN